MEFFTWSTWRLLPVRRCAFTFECTGKEALTKSADPGDDILPVPVLRDGKQNGLSAVSGRMRGCRKPGSDPVRAVRKCAGDCRDGGRGIMILTFILGLIGGAAAGVAVMALVEMAKDKED